MNYSLLATGLKAALVLETLDSSLKPSVVYYYRSIGEHSSAHDRLENAVAGYGVEVNPRSFRLSGERSLTISIGWQYLIEEAAELVVLHDSLLPKYRGFAPTVTALIRGDRQLGVTAIRAVAETDAGPILSQHAVGIRPPIAIAEAFERLASCYVGCIKDVLAAEEAGQYRQRLQDDSAATYSIWRDDLDFYVDWRQRADVIRTHVLAVGYPYSGAKSRLGDLEVCVVNAEVIDDVQFEIRQPGKIWKIHSRTSADVVCGEGMLRIEVSDALSLNRPLLNRLRVRFN